jgi:transcriptional regulator with XRE-family HTH domain
MINPSEGSLGRNIKRYREAAGLSQAELAEALSEAGVPGMHPQTITKLEAGSRSLKFTEGIPLAKILEVGPSALMLTDERESEFAGAILAVHHACSALEAAQSKAAQSVIDAERARNDLRAIYTDAAKIAGELPSDDALRDRWEGVERRAVGHLAESTEGFLRHLAVSLTGRPVAAVEGGRDGVDSEAR